MYRVQLIAFLLLLSLGSKAIELPRTIKNTIYSDNIKTVEMYRSGWKLSNPIINLNSEDQLVLSFDDLVDEGKNYYYTIFHCDRNWQQSKIGQEEYLDSFTDFPINDYEFSINTTVRYVNYRVTIPNDDVPIILSGNYAMVVFDKDYPDQPLITWRFYVVEPKASIYARIRRATHDPINGTNQEVDFIIDHGGINVNDAITDIQAIVTQNNRDDNAIRNLKPLFMSKNRLEYDYSMENVFKGGNEFRYFEIRGIKHPGEGVEEINLYPPIYHATLFAHRIRRPHPYTYYQDMNGGNLIEAYNVQYSDVEADYQLVHFTLPMSNPPLGGKVYVLGKLSNWDCNKTNEMSWNMDRNQYELTLLLKQGYYNFIYAYKDEDRSVYQPENLEGSYHQTENDYQIYVYYGRITDRYDRLIGYQKFNSLTNRTY